jgi:DNA repair protein RecO (recombination protein O)
MYRSISTLAIVLRRERLGEFHKALVLLTSDLGLLSATAYGAYKMQSRLRMGSEPFTCSRVLLYRNPVKDSYKVTDLEILETFTKLQEDLSRLANASLWAEVVLKSYGGGEVSQRLFQLFRDSLRLLDAANARQQPYLTVQFLWRFLSLAGYQPGIDACDLCEASLDDAACAFFAPQRNSLLCEECGRDIGDPFPAGARRYLAASQSLPLERAADIRLDSGGLRALEDSLPRMVQAVLEKELICLRYIGASL